MSRRRISNQAPKTKNETSIPMDDDRMSENGKADALTRDMPQKAYGIATIANDKVYDWLLPFLESWAVTNRATPLYVIPYDDNCAKTRAACEIYGAHFVEPDHQALDALAKRLYPLFPNHRRRLRKFLSLALPLDEVIYVDVDIVLVRDMSVFFGKLRPGEVDFIVASPVETYVYNKKRPNYPFLKDVICFNDGFFVTAKSILSLDDIYAVIDKDEAIFHTVRQRGMLFAQPLTNFVTHYKGMKIVPIPGVLDNGSSESFYKAEGVTFDAEGWPLDQYGKDIYFVHWAGATSLPKKRVFDDLWLKFTAAAVARLELAKTKMLSRV